MKPCTWRSAAPAASLLPLLFIVSCGGDVAGPDYDSIVKVVVTASPSTHFFLNETVQLHASFEDVEGRSIPGPAVTWKSPNSDYIQVSPSGLVTALRPAGVRITATAAGRSGEIFVEAFNPAPPREPTSFHARAVSNTEIQTAWRGGRTLVEAFELERELVGLPEDETGGFTTLVTSPDTAYGDFSVTPKQAYRYRVRACNRFGCSDYSSTVGVTSYATLRIETAELPLGYVAEAYSTTLEANEGTGEITWSLVDGTLPPGLSLYGDKLQGGPTRVGSYDFTIRATGGGQTAERALSIEISGAPLPPVVTTASLPEGILGKAYQALLFANRGDKSYTWALTGGSLPPGLTLAANGEISGTPSAVGKFAFTVEVTSAGMTGEAELVIDVAYPPIAIELILPRSGRLGEEYTETLHATGGDGTNFAWSVVSGQLPPGLSLGATTGAITGTPTIGGFFPFTVQVASGGRTATQGFYIDVYDGDPLLIENWYLPVAIQGEPYSQKIETSGGEGSSYEFRLIAGALPPLLSLDPATGVISGTTSGSAGTFFFTVEVESGAQKATRSLSLTVSSVGVEGFNIAIANVSNRIPTPDFMVALNRAVRKWESIITTDFPPFTMPGELGANFCQGHGNKLRAGDVIEDFVILLGVQNLDGPGGVVGRAGPCGYVLGEPMMFRSGSFLMDESELPWLNQDQMMAISLHEIGHALGIGTMWDIVGRTLISGKGGDDPRYTGAAGVAAYKALGGMDAAIAVENSGAEGTRDGHWRETTFDTELMTGFIEGSGIPMPLSRMTVMSLVDLGYAVDAAGADPYTLPWGAALGAAEGERSAERIELHDDVAIEPYIRVVPGGSLRLEQRR